ncbi:MAG TPA: hypothetical protein VLC74_05115 [Rhizomicrobium sp.]|nr:hypothetical protein [Rhizomicrobium sp.]
MTLPLDELQAMLANHQQKLAAIRQSIAQANDAERREMLQRVAAASEKLAEAIQTEIDSVERRQAN